MTPEQVRVRAKILEVMLEVLEKPFSDKTGSDVSPTLDIAGLNFTDKGVRKRSSPWPNVSASTLLRLLVTLCM